MVGKWNYSWALSENKSDTRCMSCDKTCPSEVVFQIILTEIRLCIRCNWFEEWLFILLVSVRADFRLQIMFGWGEEIAAVTSTGISNATQPMIPFDIYLTIKWSWNSRHRWMCSGRLRVHGLTEITAWVNSHIPYFIVDCNFSSMP